MGEKKIIKDVKKLDTVKTDSKEIIKETKKLDTIKTIEPEVIKEEKPDEYDEKMDELEEFTQKSDTLKILEIMLDSSSNLKLKSEIKRPLQFSALYSNAEWVDSRGLKMSSQRIYSFIKTTLELYISYKRQGRKEIIEAVRTSAADISMPDNMKLP